MPTLTIEYEDDAQRLALEQAIAYVTQLHSVALNASYGTVLDTCEKLALTDGRALLRSTLTNALHSRIASDEKKGGTHAAVRKRTPDAPRDATHEPS